MDEWLQQYKRHIADSKGMTDEALMYDLNRSREGNDSARLAISGSYLYLALRIAEQRAMQGNVQLKDLIEEANHTLQIAIGGFQGNSNAAFETFAANVIGRHLDDFLGGSP